MGKRVKRWPIWKIAVAGGACVLAAVVLFCLSVFMARLGEPAADTSGQPALLGLPTFIMILGVAASMLAILSTSWLVLRIQEARTPPWERRSKRRRR